MIPFVSDVARDSAKRLAEEAVPALSGFVANNVAMISAMLAMIGERWDSAAADLVAENADIHAVLSDAAQQGFVATAPDAASLTADLRLSALRAHNGGLRTALIALHEAVEAAQTPAARQIEDRIWAALRAATDRQRISSANF